MLMNLSNGAGSNKKKKKEKKQKQERRKKRHGQLTHVARLARLLLDRLRLGATFNNLQP